jgi:hypothetical protein
MAFPKTGLNELFGFSGLTKIGAITLDAAISQSHSLEADVTDHPVEDGSDITDNHRARPKTIQITGQVSDSPIQTGFPLQTAISSTVSAIKQDDPVQAAWDTFNQYFENSELITVSTSLREYKNMLIVGLQVPRDVRTGKILRFTITLKQVRIVTTASTEAIPVPETTTGGKGKEGEKKSEGDKPTKKANGEQSKSVLAEGYDKGTDYVKNALRV